MQKISSVLCFDPESPALVVLLGYSPVVMQIVSLRVSIIVSLPIISLDSRFVYRLGFYPLVPDQYVFIKYFRVWLS